MQQTSTTMSLHMNCQGKQIDVHACQMLIRNFTHLHDWLQKIHEDFLGFPCTSGHTLIFYSNLNAVNVVVEHFFEKFGSTQQT